VKLPSLTSLKPETPPIQKRGKPRPNETSRRVNIVQRSALDQVPANSPPAAKARRTAVPTHRGTSVRLARRPDAPDPSDLDSVRRWLNGVTGPRVVDVFSGAGGLSLGLEEAGFTVLVGADNDPWAVETHAANLGGLGYVGDLTDPEDFIDHLDGWGIDTVDLVSGGAPCQPFSRAGRSKVRELVLSGSRSENDPRASLWRSFIAVVDRLAPRMVLIENVPDLPTWNDGTVLVGLLESLRALGYWVQTRVLDCFAYGVPQHRARLFIIAGRNSAPFEWPAPSERLTTLGDAICDLPPVPGGQRAEQLPYRRRPRAQLSAFQRRMRAGLRGREGESIRDHITRSVRDDDMEAYQLLGEGQTYADLPERLQRYRSDIFTDKYKRLAWSELSRTITAHLAKDGYWYIHPDQNRTLSVREAARIQTFPDRFRFAGQPSHRYRQIGNAVPPMMARALGTAIRAHLEGSGKAHVGPASANENSVRQDLLAWHKDHRRTFPWRAIGLHPWHVLMAEMCLHRTRADQVAPVFEALLRLAPTPDDMVQNAEEALAVMRSLGLRWRAENLVAVARELVDLFDGEVPDDDLGLRMLPGVGDYVAQAVLCFGFGRRAVLLDTNTVRIVSRLNARDARRRWQLRLDLYQLAGTPGPDAEFNYALLDLGALICGPSRPRCDICPLRRSCVTGTGVEPPVQLMVGVAA
jgi:DNA (cytosine-5)-methyltransferase 1